MGGSKDIHRNVLRKTQWHKLLEKSCKIGLLWHHYYQDLSGMGITPFVTKLLNDLRPEQWYNEFMHKEISEKYPLHFIIASIVR